MGCLLPVVVHAANIYDTKGGISTAQQAFERYPSIQKFCADAGYRGAFVSDVKEQLGLELDISEKIKEGPIKSTRPDWQTNFHAPRGKKSQEYFVYFKIF